MIPPLTRMIYTGRLNESTRSTENLLMSDNNISTASWGILNDPSINMKTKEISYVATSKFTVNATAKCQARKLLSYLDGGLLNLVSIILL